MSKGYYVQKLLRLIHAYHLDDRHPDELASVLFMAEHGLLTDDQARAWLLRIQPWIDELERKPNLLPRAPDADELGTFDIEIGELVERPGTRVGIRLLDRPRHFLVSGATGSGKTNILRIIIHGIDRLNKNE